LAATLKTYDLLTDPADAEGSWWGWLSTITVGIEFFIGLWLVAGAYPKQARIITILCFIVLALVSLAKIATGEASCGCFGKLRVSPFFTLGFDVLALGALWWCRPAESTVISAGTRPWRVFVPLVIFVVLAISVGFRFVQSRPGALSTDGDIIGNSQSVVLDPKSWVGRQFPLIRYIDVGEDLAHGDWIVMLYRWECTVCQEVLPQYIELAHALASQSHNLRVALIELPSFSNEIRPPPQHDIAFARGRLDDARRWVVGTPLFLRIRSGEVDVVTSVPRALLYAPTAMADSAGQLLVGSDYRSEGKASSFPGFLEFRHREFLREVACGPLSLLAVLRDLGANLSSEKVQDILSEAGEHGTDLLKLSRMAEKLGYQTLGVEVTPDKLAQMGHRAIVHLNGIGFAAVVGYTPQGFRVVYPLQPPGLIPGDLFERSFGKKGNALLVSDSALVPTRLGLSEGSGDAARSYGSHLELSRSMLVVGRIHRREWEGSLTITNSGNEPLQIEKATVSCPGCSASVASQVIAPGDSSLLRANGAVTRSGGFTTTIELTTNQDEQKVVRIPVRGYVEQPVAFDRPAAEITGLLPGQAADFSVPLAVSSDVKVELLRAVAAGTSLLAPEVRIQPDGNAILHVHFKGDERIGWQRHAIAITSDPSADAVPTFFHLAVEIRPEVKVFPQTTLVREEDCHSGWKRSFELDVHTSVRGTPSVVWSDSALRQLAPLSCRPLGNRHWIIGIESPADAVPFSKGKYSLVITYGEGRTLRVPVYFGESSLLAPD